MKKNIQSLLIIGKLPPPIGGVTIHVRRLLDSLEGEPFNYSFKALTLKKLPDIFQAIARSGLVHLHTSSVPLRLLFVLWSRIVGVKLMFTLHGDLGRYGWFKNTIDELSIRWAGLPVVINSGSFAKATRINSDTLLLSAFIPPVKITPLESSLSERLNAFRQKYRWFYCTNAYRMTFDSSGNEIYGITELVEIFRAMPSRGLVFADPSHQYSDYFAENKIAIPENVLVIDHPHDFINVLKLSDAFLRTTTTDGDSLSVREGLFFGKPVIASDCVQRPDGCILYETGNNKELKEAIESMENLTSTPKLINGFNQLREVYNVELGRLR